MSFPTQRRASSTKTGDTPAVPALLFLGYLEQRHGLISIWQYTHVEREVAAKVIMNYPRMDTAPVWTPHDPQLAFTSTRIGYPG
jgi:hypothetical protein